jgi:hypothetical protein
LSIAAFRLILNTSLMILYEFLRPVLSGIYYFYTDIYIWLLRLVRISEIRGGKKMQNFVLTGKAKTVFKLIELKAKQEELAKHEKRHASGNRK